MRDHAETHHLELATVVEPDAWRRYPGIGGESRILKPDLHARLVGTDKHGSYVDQWFVEVDLGTESLPTLLKKCRQYVDYHHSGVWETPDGSGVMPFVLWVLADPDPVKAKRRRAQLETAIHRTSKLPDRLFKVALPEDISGVIQ